MKLSTILVLAASSLPALALDLAPQFITTVSEGVSIRRPYFSDAGKKYALTLDLETELTASEDGALFRFIKLPRAEMRLRPSPLGVNEKIEPANQDRYEQAARKMLPPDAKDVVLDQVTFNPMPINGWTGVRFTFQFQTPAGEVRQSLMFLNILPAQQVVVQIASMAKDFTNASDRGMDILRRWHELDAKAGAGGS